MGGVVKKRAVARKNGRWVVQTCDGISKAGGEVVVVVVVVVACIGRVVDASECVQILW